ncbi:anti-sigma regulatory factor [Streptomyces sp. NRRL S-87]|uniref:ATP-binding protein n=1 Tax=Streptomyces sp. NRRL S-87 TaxID=1463920 RepID=UPI0007C4C5FC|nr:anti-sigma regulatory factor [Streptomyces sp. NRRL S-87]
MTDPVRLAERPTELQVPATLGALADIAAFVLGLADQAGLGKRATYRLRLAVDELATNIVTHGYRGGDGRITVRGRAGAGRVRVRLEDTAPAFDPVAGCLPPATGVPPERRRVGGLGIHLALTSVDEFGYVRSDGRNISTLTVLGEDVRRTRPCPPRP